MGKSAIEQILEIQRSMTSAAEMLKRGNPWHDSLSFQTITSPAREAASHIREKLAGVTFGREVLEHQRLFKQLAGHNVAAGMSNPFLDAIHEMKSRMSIIDGLKDIASLAEKMALTALPPSLAVVEALKSTSVATLMCNPEMGLFSRLLPQEPEVRVLHAPMAPIEVTPRAPRVIEVPEVTKCFCSRCGKELLSAGRYGSTETLDEFVGLWVAPWCECLKDWDGTGEDLVRKMRVKLRLIEGGGQGDGVPIGQLYVVEVVEEEEGGDEEG